MKKPHREHERLVRPLLFGLSLFLAIPCSFSLAQAVMPITPSGLNTQIGAPTALPGGETMYDITGGTRPGNGPNLFHSFGDFNVPNHNIANFLNDSCLATSNILGRVTGGNISNIFGTIQTTGFGNANLFLMNPAGFLFGPTATVNVGGMMTFSTANYLKLADGVRFNSTPTFSADLLLSTAPVAAFGFLGSNPGAITVQGSHLSVADGAGISLVGGNITVQAGTLTAPSGDITLVSVGRPSHQNVGGEVVIAVSGPGAGFTPTGFRSLGTINLSQGSTLDVSAPASSGNSAGSVVIRGGQLVIDDSSIKAAVPEFCCLVGLNGGAILLGADNIALNQSTLDASSVAPGGVGGAITLVSRGGLDIQNSNLSASGSAFGFAGTVDLNAGTRINLTSTMINAFATFGGSITMAAPVISLRGSGLDVDADFAGPAGTINLTATKAVSLSDGTLLSAIGAPGGGPGGTIQINGGARFTSQQSTISAISASNGGTINLTATKAVSLSNGTLLSVDGGVHGGTIRIDGGARFTSQQSTISAAGFFSGAGNGGTIQVEANKVVLTDTQLTTSTSTPDVSQSVGGSITVDANRMTLKNSQILSTATEGHGGTISLTGTTAMRLTHGTVLTADGFNGGTVLINGGTLFRSQQSTISAQSGSGNGGTIQVEANKIGLTDTQLTTSTSTPDVSQSVGGSITVDANRMTLKNSQILSTATEGHGGTIDITSPIFHQHAGSVIDASSQAGTNGTVTINGVIQP